MKHILTLYRRHRWLALIVNSVAFFVWIVTVILVVTILAAAFGGH